MRNLLVLGAGKSSPYLIKYLLDNAAQNSWTVTVADSSLEAAQEKVGNHMRGIAIVLNINNDDERKKNIRAADLVISLLPPALHEIVAIDCLTIKKNLVTASYVSQKMQEHNQEAIDNGLLFLNECGLDPGIDHMSAMHIINDIKSNGGTIRSFKSYTGGLIAPQYNNNPWGYKFTWNPRNVILAGQGTAKYIQDRCYKYIPYNRLYQQIEKIKITNTIYDAYANRDSLAYRKHYGIEEIPTLLRGTLRSNGFCAAWNIFVQLGITDDTYIIENSHVLSYRDFILSHLPVTHNNISVEELLKNFIKRFSVDDEGILEKIISTGLLSTDKIPLTNATPAAILQHLLESKWKLLPTDADQIVMTHRFIYNDNKDKSFTLQSNLIVTGENSVYTAMAKTVGLPLAIAAKNIVNGNINLKGVHIPVHPDIYSPILPELKEHGIVFNDSITAI
jgi:saccharopine dehydrogenase-like NADP-dependent oxidoreductase